MHFITDERHVLLVRLQTACPDDLKNLHCCRCYVHMIAVSVVKWLLFCSSSYALGDLCFKHIHHLIMVGWLHLDFNCLLLCLPKYVLETVFRVLTLFLLVHYCNKITCCGVIKKWMCLNTYDDSPYTTIHHVNCPYYHKLSGRRCCHCQA